MNVCWQPGHCTIDKDLKELSGPYSEPNFHHDSEHIIMKKRSERRKHCALAVVRQKFAPPQTPFPEAQDGPNLIDWRWSLPQARSYVQERGGSCLLVPRRLNFF